MSKSELAEDLHNFVPREQFMPNKDSPGVSKTVFTHVSTLHGLLNDWNKIKDKGVKLCRAILSLKLHECEDDYYPSQLIPLTESLVEALDSLKNIVDGVKIVEKQLKAVAQLQPTDEPVILTWTTMKISNAVAKISESVQKEYKLKLTITENIAHCRDEKLIDVYVTSWELDPYLEPNGYLFAEFGLSVIQ